MGAELHLHVSSLVSSWVIVFVFGFVLGRLGGYRSAEIEIANERRLTLVRSTEECAQRDARLHDGGE